MDLGHEAQIFLALGMSLDEFLEIRFYRVLYDAAVNFTDRVNITDGKFSYNNVFHAVVLCLVSGLVDPDNFELVPDPVGREIDSAAVAA